MNRSLRSPWYRVTLLLSLFFILNACQQSTAEQDNGQELRTVRLETVTQDRAEGVRRFVGIVDALSTVDLAFQVGGRITRMPVQQGTIVPRGGLIAELDDADYALAVSEARVALDLSRLDYERNRKMLDSGAIPRATYDRAAADLEMRELALSVTQRNLAYTSIEAPFDALVTRRIVDSFTQVQAGTAVVRVQDVTELRVHISVPESLMAMLETPERFTVTAELSAYPGRQFELGYREHSTEADPVTQTYQVSFGLARQPGINILPGMTATVSVQSGDNFLPPRIDIPASALDTADDGSFRVWVFNADAGTVSPRAVGVGALGTSRVVINEGLQSGEQVVTAGAHMLHDGMAVTPFRNAR
ncbi:MAG: efflux RND transporter periplasmic adaptor subunit [Pseudohongiella sp.]|uniref:efflux RND transporter periplasmic adaptor subunit n=1 Tax=Pseudohongiella sp. TaxID=1979412 RepID=UPI0034A07456